MDIIILDNKNITDNKRWFLCKGNLYEYLMSLKEDFFSFAIQRKIVKNQYLDSIIDTIMNHEPIPIITLVANSRIIIENERSNPDFNNIEILDGLQRTYRLWCYFKLSELFVVHKTKLIDSDPKVVLNRFRLVIKDDSLCSDFLSKKIINLNTLRKLLDFQDGTYQIEEVKTVFQSFELYFIIWEGLNSKEIIKKMLVLNAGQTPVSRTHQYELLFLHYLKDLNESKLKIRREREDDSMKIKRGNREIGTFLFSSIIIALESLVSEKPMMAVDSETLMQVESDFDSENTLSLVFEASFLKLFANTLYEFDKIISAKEPQNGLNWFGKDTSLSGFFGAIGKYININNIDNSELLHEKFTRANDILKNTINDTGLDLTNFDQQYNSLSSRKINIGSYVRKATYNFILYSLEGKDFTWNVAFKDQ